MNEACDSDLFLEFAIRGSEAASERLVARHVNLVYSAALRQVGEHSNFISASGKIR